MTDIDELEPQSGSSGLAQALKIAAAAAAVGAAAGAAAAIAGRNGHDHEDEPHDSEEPDEPDAHEAPTDEADPEPEAERDDDDAEDEEEPPLPAAEQDEEPEQEYESQYEPVAGGTFDQTADVVRRAREQLTALRGSEPESVSELTRTHDGWTVTFEVVEVARIPETTDVMASYALVLDDDANLVHYARTRRYSRAQAEQEEGA